jgi:hypothetical protein
MAGEIVPIRVVVVDEDEKAAGVKALKEHGLSSERQAYFIILR